MLKEWRRQKEAQVLRNYVKEVDGLTWQKSLLKPSERQIEGDQSFFLRCRMRLSTELLVVILIIRLDLHF